MLTRMPLRLAGAGLAGLVTAVLLVAAPAFAGDGTGSVDCSQSTPQNPKPGCDATARSGDNNTTTGGKAGGQRAGDGKCRNPQGQEIPCQRDGAWAGADGCYYKPVDLSADTVAALG